jgi:NDP-sugar pyrophosphorylase family protein
VARERVGGRLFVEYLLDRLGRFDFDAAVLLVGPFANADSGTLGDGGRFSLELHFVLEPEPRGMPDARSPVMWTSTPMTVSCW